MIIDRPSSRTAALLGSAMLLLAACGAEPDQAADTATASPPASELEARAPAGAAPQQDAATPAPDPAAVPASASGASGLTAYVEKYPFEKVDGVAWNDHPAVKAGIAASVTDAAARKAIGTLEGPAAPIEMRNGKVTAWACEAHNCGAHQWSVHIDPRSGATDVCYFDEAAAATQSRWFLASGKEERRTGNCQ